MKNLIALLRSIFGSPAVDVSTNSDEATTLSARKISRTNAPVRLAGTVIPHTGGGKIDYHADTPEAVRQAPNEAPPAIPDTPVLHEPCEPDVSREEPPEKRSSREIVENETEDHPEFAVAFEEELAKCDSVSDLVELYGCVNESGKHAQAIVDKMDARSDDTFSDLQSEYHDASRVTSLTRVILKKAIALAKEPTDFISLRIDADNSDEKDVAAVEDAVKGIEWPKEKWQSLQENANDEDCESLRTIAFIKIVGFCSNTAEAIDFFIDYVGECGSGDDEVLEALYAKLFSLATRQELQIIEKLAEKYDGGDGENLRDAISGFLKK